MVNDCVEPNHRAPKRTVCECMVSQKRVPVGFCWCRLLANGFYLQTPCTRPWEKELCFRSLIACNYRAHEQRETCKSKRALYCIAASFSLSAASLFKVSGFLRARHMLLWFQLSHIFRFDRLINQIYLAPDRLRTSMGMDVANLPRMALCSKKTPRCHVRIHEHYIFRNNFAEE